MTVAGEGGDGSDSSKWVLPTEIQFDLLKGNQLEECVFWLLDGIGAKNIGWRIGGKGGGAAAMEAETSRPRFSLPVKMALWRLVGGKSNARGEQKRSKKKRWRLLAIMLLRTRRSMCS